MSQDRLKQQTERAYIEAFSRCYSFTKGLILRGEEVNLSTMQMNVDDLKSVYHKIKNKPFSLKMDLNEIERKLSMEITQ